MLVHYFKQNIKQKIGAQNVRQELNTTHRLLVSVVQSGVAKSKGLHSLVMVIIYEFIWAEKITSPSDLPCQCTFVK